MDAFKRELEDIVANDPETRKSPIFTVAGKPADPSPAKVNVATDVKAFMQKLGGMYDGQRKMLLDLEAEYDSDRAKLIDAFRRRMDDLQHEAVEAVRALDARHGTIISEAKQILNRLGKSCDG